MDDEGLRDLYKSILADGRFSEAGGRWSGMIDIARKSKKSKLEYGFVPYDADNAFFSLNERKGT